MTPHSIYMHKLTFDTMQGSQTLQCLKYLCRLAQAKGGAKHEVSIDTPPALPVRTFNKFLKILILSKLGTT